VGSRRRRRVRSRGPGTNGGQLGGHDMNAAPDAIGGADRGVVPPGGGNPG
jgi:hypothetical protein